MSDRTNNGGASAFSIAVLSISICILSLGLNIWTSRKKQKIKQPKAEQEQKAIKEMVQDSLKNTIEYKEAMEAYKKMLQKQQEIESGFNSGKTK